MSWDIKIITESDFCPYLDTDFICSLISEHHIENCDENKCPLKIKEEQ